MLGQTWGAYYTVANIAKSGTKFAALLNACEKWIRLLSHRGRVGEGVNF